MKTITKSKFSQLNNKIFYFTNGIFSLPFGHENLKEVDDLKNWKLVFGGKREVVKNGKKSTQESPDIEHFTPNSCILPEDNR